MLFSTFLPRTPCQLSVTRNCPRKDLPRSCTSAITAGAVALVPSNPSNSYCFASGSISADTCDRGSKDTSAPVSSNTGTFWITMPVCSDLTITSATGAGGSNRAASYACIIRLPDFHHKIPRIFRMRQLWRADPGDGRRETSSGFLLDTQMDASSLWQRERLKGAKCAVAEDGIDTTDHVLILSAILARCIRGFPFRRAACEPPASHGCRHSWYAGL